MGVGGGQGLESKGQEEKHWGGQLEKGGAGRSRTRPMGPSPRQDMPHKCCRKEETLMVKTRHRHGVKGSGVEGTAIHLLPIPSPPFMPHDPFFSCHTPLASHP